MKIETYKFEILTTVLSLHSRALTICPQVEGKLEKFYPEKIEGTIPTIEEIEQNLNGKE